MENKETILEYLKETYNYIYKDRNLSEEVRNKRLDELGNLLASDWVFEIDVIKPKRTIIMSEYDKKFKKYEYNALEQKVLAVAITDSNYMSYKVYIGSVIGNRHDEEFMQVAENGAKLTEDIARAIFPDLAEKYKYDF